MVRRNILVILMAFIAIIFFSKVAYGLATAPPLGAHFPQRITPPGAYLDTPLIEGQLTIDQGCLRVRRVKNLIAGDNFLLIWDPRYSTRSEEGIVHVIDRDSGEVLASVNDFIVLGGGGMTYPTWLWLKQPIPAECPGPYWLVGDYIRKINVP